MATLKPNEPSANANANRFCTARDVELGENGADVEFYSVLGNIEGLGDRPIRKPVSNLIQHLNFPKRQGFYSHCRINGTERSIAASENHSGSVGMKQSKTVRNHLNRPPQLMRRNIHSRNTDTNFYQV